MCQEPCIRMCVRSTRSPENQISRCLPRASTRSIVLPAIRRSSLERASFAKTDSKRVTVRPASARLSVRAARKIVSPSGTRKLPTPNFQLPTWDLGIGSWELGVLVDRIVPIDVGYRAVRIEVALVNVAEIFPAYDW